MQVAVFSPSTVLTVMVAVPLRTPVTRPFSSTVATEGSLLSHVTVLFVALSGSTVAVSVSDAPVEIGNSSSRDTPATGMLNTVTVQVAVLVSPVALGEVTVMVAVPAAPPVTTPLASTVATEGVSLLHVTLSAALLGEKLG